MDKWQNTSQDARKLQRLAIAGIFIATVKAQT